MSKLAAAIGVVAALGVVGAGIAFGGELGQFLLAGVEMIPFIILAVLAQLGQKRLWARGLAYIWLSLMVLAYSLLVVALTFAALSQPGAGSALAGLGLTALVLFGSFVVSVPFLFHGVRVRLARTLPVEPGSLLHKVALFFVVFFVLASFGQLMVLAGQPSLLTTIQGAGADPTGGRSSAGQILDLFYGLAWMLPMAAIAAGYPLRRTFRQVLARLGLVMPTWRQAAFGLGAAVALVFVLQGVDYVVAWLWGLFSWPTTDAEAFKQLMGAGFSPVGAVAVGITAGIGEEVATRGLLQPRLGKVLPNLAFTAAHAFQYAPDALVGVFITGLILAFVRARSNTSTAAIVHGGYDFFVVMLDVLGF